MSCNKHKLKTKNYELQIQNPVLRRAAERVENGLLQVRVAFYLLQIVFPQEEPLVDACVLDGRAINAFAQIFRNAFFFRLEFKSV